MRYRFRMQRGKERVRNVGGSRKYYADIFGNQCCLGYQSEKGSIEIFACVNSGRCIISGVYRTAGMVFVGAGHGNRLYVSDVI